MATTARAGGVQTPVVGGTRVQKGEWPDVVDVVSRNSRCTGTLIAPDIVITAGHCVAAGPVEVVVGTVDLASRAGLHIPVKWSRAYPSWETTYDVGVLVLEHAAFVVPRAIAAACHARELLVPGAPIHVVGFGMATPAGDDGNTELREAAIPVVDPTCTEDAGCNVAVQPHGEFIAGGHGADACFGDSGGPTYLDTPQGPALVGVVSRGRAVPGAPCGNGGIYVRADKVVSWIQSVTGGKLRRTSCSGRADGEEGVEDDTVGCNAGSGAGLGVAVGLILLRRRRR